MLKKIELAIVVPVKGRPGRCVGTLTRNVSETSTLPEIVKAARKDLGEDAEGCILLSMESYQESVHDWMKKHQKVEAPFVEDESLTSEDAVQAA